MAKWPQVETPLDGMGLRPGTGYIPLECSWSGWFGWLGQSNDDVRLYQQQERKSGSPTKNDGEKEGGAPGWHPLPAIGGGISHPGALPRP